jgi:hypothetical protein
MSTNPRFGAVSIVAAARPVPRACNDSMHALKKTGRVPISV